MTTSDNLLGDLRKTVAQLDEEILAAILRRVQVARQMGRWKQNNDVPISQPEVEAVRIRAARVWAQSHYMDPDFAEAIITLIISESRRQQELQQAEKGIKA